ncbi:MAG TPA: glycosyltransferase family 39 protein, partial [Chroococcales cyanobacterium]
MGIQTLKKPWLWLCLLFAFLWRIPLLQGGIWRDEGLVLFIQRLPPSAMLSFLKLHESHPPLFYLIMRPWTLLFGEGAGLVLPFLFGLLLVVFVYRIGKTVFSEDTGIFAAALVAFSPSLVNYSTELRPYSLLSILCLLSTSFLWLALREGKSKDWGLYSATTLGMLFLHNWAWLVFAGQGLMFGLSFSKRPLSSLLRQWGASQGLVLLLYSPWFSALFFQFRHAGYPPRPLGFLFALDLLAEATFSLPLLMVVLLLAAFFLLLREEEIGERLPYLLFLGIPLVVFALAFGLSSGRGMINNALFSV